MIKSQGFVLVPVLILCALLTMNIGMHFEVIGGFYQDVGKYQVWMLNQQKLLESLPAIHELLLERYQSQTLVVLPFQQAWPQPLVDIEQCDGQAQRWSAPFIKPYRLCLLLQDADFLEYDRLAASPQLIPNFRLGIGIYDAAGSLSLWFDGNWHL